ncbi:MAG: hypothetical protein Q9194_002596 [Teloschistes cf. exilis]
MTSTFSSHKLPDFLFDAWKLRPGNLSEARKRNELDGWNVSSLCSAYLKYQLDRYNEKIREQSRVVVPSLFSLSLGRILEHLNHSTNLHEEVREIAASHNSAIPLHLMRDPRTPYKLLRLLDASRPATYSESSGYRKLVDIDDAVLASERYCRSADVEYRSNFLVTLDDLSVIHGPLDEHEIISIKRKSPPNGGFEFLDAKRKPAIELHGSDRSFTKTFDRVTHGILKGLDWNHVFVAGGMIFNTLLHTELSKDDQKDLAECDIDLYLYNLTPEEANRKVEDVYNCWLNNLASSDLFSTSARSNVIVIKNSRTINFIPKYPNRRIQIILKLLASPLDILLNFDLDACALGFDGSRVLMLPRCARALESGYSVFTMDLIWGHHLGNRRETQEIRLFKYADRGFGMRILPSYVKSLEEEYEPDGALSHEASSDAEARSTPEGKSKFTKKRTEWTRIVKGEHGLKTVKRIAYLGQQFVQQFYFGDFNPFVKTLREEAAEHCDGDVMARLTGTMWCLRNTAMYEGSTVDASLGHIDVGEDDATESLDVLDDGNSDQEWAEQVAADKMDSRPIIRLYAIDGHSMHEAWPEGRKRLGAFELLMRHCEAWRLDAIGKAWLDRRSDTDLGYEDVDEYHGLPTYEWDSSSLSNFEVFESMVENYNNRLFRLLRMMISDRVHIHYGQGSFVSYLTRRIRCLVVGQDLKSVQEKQLTRPLVIPADLQMIIQNELRTQKAGLPDDVVSKYVIPVHDSSKYDPRTATVPSLPDNATESGNLRYWLLTSQTMWAVGHERALHEVAELLMALSDWFARSDGKSDPDTGLFNPGTDNGHCIWHLAQMFRRRLVLPEASEETKRGQTLGSRETRLFRAWVLTPPVEVVRGYDLDVVIANLQKKLKTSVDVLDHLFWTDGDEGSWDIEEGVPVWQD